MYCTITYISIKRNHLYCEKGFLSMSPTPNYYPQGTKLSEIEGKNIWRVCLFFFLYGLGWFDTTLAYSSGHVWLTLLETGCVWSSVQSDYSCGTEACECVDLMFDAWTRHFLFAYSKIGSEKIREDVTQCLQQHWWGHLITMLPVDLSYSEWSLYLMSRLWSCTKSAQGIIKGLN